MLEITLRVQIKSFFFFLLERIATRGNVVVKLPSYAGKKGGILVPPEIEGIHKLTGECDVALEIH